MGFVSELEPLLRVQANELAVTTLARLYIQLAVLGLYTILTIRHVNPAGLKRLLALSPALVLASVLPSNTLPADWLLMRTVMACTITFTAQLKILAGALGYGVICRLADSSLVDRLRASVALLLPAAPVDDVMKEHVRRVRSFKGHCVAFVVHTLLYCVLLLIVRRELAPRMHDFVFDHIGNFLMLASGLDIAAVIVQLITRHECVVAFDIPYLAKDLKDFWTERWNVLIATLLRDFPIYPLRDWLFRNRKKRSQSRDSGAVRFLLMLASFFVSALGHELIFVHICDIPGASMVFFLCNALGVIGETLLKQALGKRRESKVVKLALRLFTIGFIMTGSELYFFGLLSRKCAFHEYTTAMLARRLRYCIQHAPELMRNPAALQAAAKRLFQARV